MNVFIVCFEIIGTVAFAISGAMTALKKEMDVFGTCILGLTTAVGGGILRDLLLGITPPSTFRDPKYVLISIAVSLIIFITFVRRIITANRRVYDTVMLVTDSAGLGIFTVYGLKVAMDAGFGDNLFLVIFVAVITGVGGGVMRDIFAGDRPYIFVKHIYACASLAGAILCALLWNAAGEDVSIIAGFALIIAIRFCAAHFRWSLPRAKAE